MSILSGPWGKNKTPKLIKRLRESLAKSEWDDNDANDFERLIQAAVTDIEVAKQAVGLIWDEVHNPELVVRTLNRLLDSHLGNSEFVIGLGFLAERCRNIDYLNDPPESDFLPRLIEAFECIDDGELDTKTREGKLDALQTTARLAGRAYDETAEACCKELISANPNHPPHLYSLGLFFKTRGRFAEGADIYRQALEIYPDAEESYLWNLGICATGARMPELALHAWKALGIDIDLGAFGLPEGNFASVKVRLAEHPLAERTGLPDEPGLEETIWIERLGPCHGIVRSVLHQDLGVDYGDVILFDGAPITYHTYGEDKVPVFPHLCTLERGDFKFYDFAATQTADGAIAELSKALPEDAVVYVHSEQMTFVCQSCWEDSQLDHNHGNDVSLNRVTGRIAAPSKLDAATLLDQLDRSTATMSGARLYSTDLCQAAGDRDRAMFESKKLQLLVQS